MKNLTPKQKIVYDFIREFIEQKQYSPSIDEIGAGIRLRSTATVSSHLRSLEGKGWITREYNHSRSIEITGPAKRLAKPKKCRHCGGTL